MRLWCVWWCAVCGPSVVCGAWMVDGGWCVDIGTWKRTDRGKLGSRLVWGWRRTAIGARSSGDSLLPSTPSSHSTDTAEEGIKRGTLRWRGRPFLCMCICHLHVHHRGFPASWCLAGNCAGSSSHPVRVFLHCCIWRTALCGIPSTASGWCTHPSSTPTPHPSPLLVIISLPP